MGNNKRVPTVMITEDAYEKFNEAAKNQGKTFSQALREAMSEYLEKQGIQADFNVGEWGGKRERPQKVQSKEGL
jgi:hypothetical protein